MPNDHNRFVWMIKNTIIFTQWTKSSEYQTNNVYELFIPKPNKKNFMHQYENKALKIQYTHS